MRGRCEVLIDLDGYSGSYFQHALVMGPLAPVQMNFLGYPGTIGAPLRVPYIGTDRVSTPVDVTESLSEKMVLLPWALMPTVQWKLRTLEHPAAVAPVVGAFHRQGKLSPAALAIWVNIVRRHAQARLWIARCCCIARLPSS